MDLHRVVTAAGNINNELPQKSVIEFIEHANRDFEKTELTIKEKVLKEELQQLLAKLPHIKDSLSRLRWIEDIMTIRCRL
ncbi:MAG: hypothetical protein WC988_01580 [Patescibacteria group bacterium]